MAGPGGPAPRRRVLEAHCATTCLWAIKPHIAAQPRTLRPGRDKRVRAASVARPEGKGRPSFLLLNGLGFLLAEQKKEKHREMRSGAEKCPSLGQGSHGRCRRSATHKKQEGDTNDVGNASLFFPPPKAKSFSCVRGKKRARQPWLDAAAVRHSLFWSIFWLALLPCATEGPVVLVVVFFRLLCVFLSHSCRRFFSRRTGREKRSAEARHATRDAERRKKRGPCRGNNTNPRCRTPPVDPRPSGNTRSNGNIDSNADHDRRRLLPLCRLHLSRTLPG